MEYNTQREQLKITSYGRIVANLINYAKTLPTKEERTAAAETIVRVMGQVNPDVRRTENYKRELWHHLMILANWELDVDCPYPLQPQERVSFSPRSMKRPRTKVQFRHYGHCIEDMVHKVADMPEGEEKELLTALLIAQMKKSYMMWNRTVQARTQVDEYNDVVQRQLEVLSNGKMKEGDIKLDVNPYIFCTADNNKPKKKKKKKKNQNHGIV